MRFPRVVALCVLVLLVGRAQSFGGGAGELAGRVLDADSGEPVQGAQILVLPWQRAGSSARDGGFSIRALSPGEGRAAVQCPSCLPAAPISFLIKEGETTTIELRVRRQWLVEKVVVEAPGLPLAKNAVPGGLDRGEIAGLPGTLGDPLRAMIAVPGVATVNDYKAEIRLGAGEPEDTLFRLDGIVVENPYHFRWARGSTAALNPEAFDQLSARTAALGADVGNTVSGLIELSPTERGAEGLVAGMSAGSLSTSAFTGGPAGEGGSWLAAGRYSNLAIYRSLYGVRRVNVPDFGDLSLRTRRPISGRLDLVAGVLALGSGLSTSDPKEGRSNHLSAGSALGYTGLDVDIDGRKRLSARIAWQGTHQSAKSSEGDDLTSQQNTLQFRLDLADEQEGRLHWKTGLEAIRSEGTIMGVIQTLESLQSVHARSLRTGAYASLAMESIPRLILDAGVRADRDSRFGAAPVQPRLRASWQATESFRVWGAASRYAQFPRYDQEFLAQGQPLKLSTADELAAGVEFKPSWNIEGEATAYIRRFNDIAAEIVNRSPDLPEAMGRFQRGTTSGVELALLRQRGRLRARLAATFLKAMESRDGVESRRNWDQPYRFDLSAAYVLSEHWELRSRFEAASGLPFSPLEPAGGGARIFGPLNSSRLPATARLDVRAAWQRKLWSARASFYFEIDNALDRRNIRSQELLWDPRKSQYFVHEESAMPLIPGLGLELLWGS